MYPRLALNLRSSCLNQDKNLKLFYVYECFYQHVCLCDTCVCIWCQWRPEGSIGPLEKQPVLLTTEPSLQLSLFKVLNIYIFMYLFIVHICTWAIALIETSEELQELILLPLCKS
jgi:hypothetical protein